MIERVLLAVDGSTASEKALDYVGSVLIAFGDGGPTVHLIHVLPPLPFHLIEAGAKLGSSAEHRDDEARERWVSEAKEGGKELLATMRQRLEDQDIAAARIDTGFLVIHPETSMAEGLLEVASEGNCDTIVVGRQSLPWYRELFHHHPADELVKKGHGATIWVVE